MLTEIDRHLLKIAGLKKIAAPAVPRGKKVVLSNDDDYAGSDDDYVVSDDIGRAYFITYKAEDGSESKRRVSVSKVVQTVSGNVNLMCYCHERAAPRCFRLDRISEAINTATGEVIDDFSSHIMAVAIHKGTFVTATQSVLKKYRHSLNILVFLGRCDNRLIESEIDVVFQYLIKNAFDADLDAKEIREHVLSLYPDTEIFFSSVRNLAQAAKKDVLRHACQLIQADDEITPDEHTFVQEMQGLLA